MVPMSENDGGPAVTSGIQQAHGISVAHGSLVQAGGSVSLHTYNHYHGPFQQAIDILGALLLVPNLRKIHLDTLSKVTPGTAIWIFKTDYWLLWLNLNGSLKILWGTGIRTFFLSSASKQTNPSLLPAGAGKSVMASVVIRELEARAETSGGSICVAYVYFRYSDAAELTVRGVLEILVKQTVERHPDCATLSEQTYARHLKERTQPTQAELLQLLHRFVDIKAATFYVLDALDEAPEKLRVDIVTAVASLNAKLFITSRPLKAIEAKFSDTKSFTIAAQDADLDLHISRGISLSENLQDLLDADSAFKQEVIASIKKNCGGMCVYFGLGVDGY